MEVKTGKNIAGAAGVKLDEALYMAQLKQGDLFEVTYAILCRPEVPNAEGRKRFDLKNWLAWWRKENVARNRAAKAFAKQYPGTRLAESVRPLENPFSCCKPRLDAELARGEQYAASLGKQLVVMPMGSFALGVLHNKPGKSLGIMKYRGSVITDDQRLKESAT